MAQKAVSGPTELPYAAGRAAAAGGVGTTGTGFAFAPGKGGYRIMNIMRYEGKKGVNQRRMRGIMTDRDLRRLSRAELLELLLEESRENERLRAKLRRANERLADKRIQLENAGSIAEAALRLNGVFGAAEQAAQQYLENVRRLAEENDCDEEKTDSGNADDGAAEG